jgi:dTDP-glucose pyrophosphorylase
MNKWRAAALSAGSNITQAIEVLDRSASQICLVVDGRDRLLGTVTDGDVRRAILRGLSMSVPVEAVMQDEPITAGPGASSADLLALMSQHRVRQVPIVDDRRVVGLVVLDELLYQPQCNNLVVLMAGGLGSRLQPLTELEPKPMLHVGLKPLLETTIESMHAHGLRRFYVAINHMGDRIRAHFGDGSRWNVDIRYLEESERRGTAGALRLLPERPEGPIIVMNADLLTRINYDALLRYHEEHAAVATMCVREYSIQIPYGVVNVDRHEIRSIDEKPVHSWFVNAGIYVLEPQLIDYIPDSGVFDMTTLFELVVSRGLPTSVFPLREYWLDIGHPEQFRQANGDYEGVFGS